MLLAVPAERGMGLGTTLGILDIRMEGAGMLRGKMEGSHISDATQAFECFWVSSPQLPQLLWHLSVGTSLIPGFTLISLVKLMFPAAT